MARLDYLYFKYNDGARFGHSHLQIRRYRIPKLSKKDEASPINLFTMAFRAAKPEVNDDEKKASDEWIESVVTRAERPNFLHITTAAKMQEKRGGFTADQLQNTVADIWRMLLEHQQKHIYQERQQNRQFSWGCGRDRSDDTDATRRK